MTFGFFVSSAQEIDKMQLRHAIEHQLAVYPQSTLQDVYKAFYQEHFDERGALYYEPIGLEGNYVRVYLKAVKDNLITAQELLQAFLDSAAARQEPAVEWAAKWNTIVEVIDAIKPGFGDSERDLLHKASLENQAVHHSRAYNAAYHPHYRIIHRNIFELLLKPMIDR